MRKPEGGFEEFSFTGVVQVRSGFSDPGGYLAVAELTLSEKVMERHSTLAWAQGLFREIVMNVSSWVAMMFFAWGKTGE